MEAIKKIEIDKVFKTILIALLGTLLLTISAKIKIPFYPVPMTMQTFVVLLLGLLLGPKKCFNCSKPIPAARNFWSTSICWYSRKKELV